MPYVLADSRNSYEALNSIPYDINDFSVQLDKPINKIKGIELLHSETTPIPTIINGWNDVVLFSDNNDSTPENVIRVQLTQGYYTPDEFINMLNGTMTDAANATSTFTSTYDPNTNDFTIISDNNSGFLSAIEAAALIGTDVDGQGDLTIADQNAFARFLILIGARSNSDFTSLSTSRTLSTECDLRSVRYFTLSVELNGFDNAELTTSNGSASFYIPRNNNELIWYSKYNNNSNYCIFNNISNVNVNNIKLKLYLEDQKGFEWSAEHDIQFLFRLLK